MNHTETIKQLNKLLANLHVLNVKLHHFHWNVQGFEFGVVHEKTEKFYDYCFAQFDDVAERILQLEGKPLTSIGSYLEAATIEEDNRVAFNGVEVFQAIIADFGILRAQAKSIMEVANSADDSGTVDMMAGLIGALEKEVWILKSSLPQ